MYIIGSAYFSWVSFSGHDKGFKRLFWLGNVYWWLYRLLENTVLRIIADRAELNTYNGCFYMCILIFLSLRPGIGCFRGRPTGRFGGRSAVGKVLWCDCWIGGLDIGSMVGMVRKRERVRDAIVLWCEAVSSLGFLNLLVAWIYVWSFYSWIGRRVVIVWFQW